VSSAVSIDRGTSDQVVDGPIISFPLLPLPSKVNLIRHLFLVDVATASSISDHRTNPW
jgi:hypothetical protein